jgi:signal transduction histidine kinase/CheY-like chemotaxis protein
MGYLWANIMFAACGATIAILIGLVAWLRVRSLVVTLQDVTARALAATRTKSEFLANMTHEIRTPINAIAGFSVLAERTVLTPLQADYVDNIRTATQSLSRIVDDLLDFSKIEAGRLEIEHVAFDLAQLVESFVSQIRPLAAVKGLALSVEQDPGVPTHLVGDPYRLGQVLANLGSNAVKFTAQGRVELEISLAERRDDRVRLRFAVRDTGIGLTKEQAGRLFQAFTQADTSTTRKFGGTGLGLVISQRLLGLMDGQIWLDSTPGIGSIFTVEIGLTVAAPATEKAAPPTRPVLGQRRLAGIAVLVVEDNPINQRLIRELLEQEGAEVTLAESGLQALSLLARHGAGAFAVALLDLQMPEMDGLETARRIRALPGTERLALIALTAHAMREDRERCFAAGMQDHIAKPIDPDRLIATLLHWAGTPGIDSASGMAGEDLVAVPAADSILPAALPGIDLAFGLRTCGNAALYRELLVDFAHHYADAPAALERMMRDGKHGDAVMLVHTLRGAAANLGMQQLAAAATALEYALEGKSPSTQRG